MDLDAITKRLEEDRPARRARAKEAAARRAQREYVQPARKPRGPRPKQYSWRKVERISREIEMGISDVRRDMPEVADVDAAHDVAWSTLHFYVDEHPGHAARGVHLVLHRLPGVRPESRTVMNLNLNLAIVAGVLASPPEVRVLPSEQRLAQLQITTRIEGRAMSVPVAVMDPPGWLVDAESGDELLIIGAVRRRFFRAAGSTASRVEIEAQSACRLSDKRRVRRLVQGVTTMLTADTA